MDGGSPAARPRRLTACSTPVSVSRPRLPSHSHGSLASDDLRAHAQVAVEGLAGLVAERAGPRSTALAHHDGRLLVEVDVLDAQPGQLATAHAAVEEQADHRVVAAVLEVGPGAGVEQLPQLGLAEDGGGVSGTWGGRIVAIGLPSISPSAASHLKNCWSARKRTDAVAGLKRT